MILMRSAIVGRLEVSKLVSNIAVPLCSLTKMLSSCGVVLAVSDPAQTRAQLRSPRTGEGPLWLGTSPLQSVIEPEYDALSTALLQLFEIIEKSLAQQCTDRCRLEIIGSVRIPKDPEIRG